VSYVYECSAKVEVDMTAGEVPGQLGVGSRQVKSMNVFECGKIFSYGAR
jgi:hypothetical protein